MARGMPCRSSMRNGSELSVEIQGTKGSYGSYWLKRRDLACYPAASSAGGRSMDLRKFLRGDIEPATRVLSYQPFILSDDVETGAAYSWMRGGDPRTAP